MYSDALLEAAAAIPPKRRLAHPTASARKSSKVCGSEVTVDLLLEGDRVVDIGMEAKACALGQASASIVARNIIGATREELLELREAMRTLLKEEGPVPQGERWRELAALQPIKDYPQRHASTLLIFEAVCAALEAATLPPQSDAECD